VKIVDPAILASAKTGDLDAYAAIVRLFHPRCLRFARSMLRNAEDAEEAVQDAWMRVFLALPRYHDQERFDSWLFRILANRCRTRSIRMVRDQRTMLHDHPAMEQAETVHPAEQAAWREEIQHALDELPEAQREAFLLHHVEGFAYEEIAAVTGVGVSALKMRVKRACDYLRGRLQEVARE
jgi:RNA polymerase sigma-70 factor (ECF subfamily)